MKTCPNCSLVFDDSAEKCTYCGYEFPVSEQPVEEAVHTKESAYSQPAPAQTENTSNTYSAYNQYNYQKPVKYCPYCGNQCDINAVICVKCGRQFTPAVSPADDKPSGWLKAICFFVPLVGLILYLVEKDKKPVSAKAYGKMALIGFILRIVLQIFWVILGMVFALVGGATSYEYEYNFGESDFYYSMIRNLFFMFK